MMPARCAADAGFRNFYRHKKPPLPIRKRRFLFVFAQNLMLAGLRSNMVLTCL